MEKIATMLVHIVYHPNNIGLVFKALSHINVDSDAPTKFSFTNADEFLALVSLPTIMVEPLFLSQVS